MTYGYFIINIILFIAVPKKTFDSEEEQQHKQEEKKAVAPVRRARVEPKSYFANERTFIQWISASLLLLTIAVLLMGYNGVDGSPSGHSSYAHFAGVGLCCGSVLMVLYATFVYFRRIKLLSSGSPYGYVDHVGPAVLSIGVCLGVVVILAEVWKAHGQRQPSYSQGRRWTMYITFEW